MKQFIETTGRTEEDAIAAALIQLGLERDDVSVEVVERAKPGFLGFGGNPAKVKIHYEDHQEPTKTEVKSDKSSESTPKTDKPVKADKAPKVEKTSKQEKKEKTTKPDSNLPTKSEEEIKGEIIQYLTGLMEKMQVEATPIVQMDDRGGFQVVLEGKNLGSVIGRRGETLDTIQQLTSYSINKGAHKRCRIYIDAENYRQKRKVALEELAQKVAAEVVRHQKNVSLEPMNAYERHIIHEALQGMANITTRSTGAEPNRRTLVCYDENA
ncbi:MAG: RNA-binding cell elongation regulator Jag/EloR [Eubacteriales bacterium]